MTDSMPVIHVRMGELVLGSNPQVLKATLGSCVGIAFIWRERDFYALAHCLLPCSPEPGMPFGARYVDQAITSVLHVLQAQPAHHAQIEVHVAGGANMSRREAGESRTPMVGQLNAEAALQLLAKQGMVVRAHDLGGICARQIHLDCATGSVRVASVPKP